VLKDLEWNSGWGYPQSDKHMAAADSAVDFNLWNILISGMLHHPGGTLSECLIKTNSRVVTAHADMKLFIQLDQLLWPHRDEFHTQTLSYVAYIGVPAVYEQLTW